MRSRFKIAENNSLHVNNYYITVVNRGEKMGEKDLKTSVIVQQDSIILICFIFIS